MRKLSLFIQFTVLFYFGNAQYSWVNKNLFPDSGFETAASFVINGMGYVIGGFTSPSLTMSNHIWQYNPITDTWIQKANYPRSVNGGAFFSINGLGYQIGGYDSATGIYSSDNNAYNPVTDIWTPKSSYPEAGVAAGYCFVINGKAYVGAGIRNNNEHGVVSGYSYDPVADTWTAIADYPGNPSIGLCTFVIDSLGYAGLGGDGNGSYFNDMFKYNPTTNRWTRIASFPAKGRYINPSCFTVKGKGYAGAGETGLNGSNNAYVLGDYYMYDPGNNTWSPAPGL